MERRHHCCYRAPQPRTPFWLPFFFAQFVREYKLVVIGSGGELFFFFFFNRKFLWGVGAPELEINKLQVLASPR